jgi:quercetin dioxygenase-like cupin family protein
MTSKTSLPPWVFNLHRADLGIPRQLAEGIQARIFAGEHAMLSVVRFEPNSTGAIHSHPEEQWGILLEGECVRIQAGEEVAMKAGDFWHTPGRVSHGIRTGASPALVLEVFSPPRREYRNAGQGFAAATSEQPGRR